MKIKFYPSLFMGLCCFFFSLTLQIANAQTATVYLTKGDGSVKLGQQGSLTFGANSGSATTITVNEGTTYQSMDGFGFTLTEGSAEVIQSLAATQQSALLNELFGSGGIAISAIRISIGASDLSSSSYSYRDGASFSLAGPDLTYLIPVIKKILAINPNIKILATPWSAPRWMKSNGAWVGGTLNAGNYQDYANYFLDYLNAMKGQGINIWGITPQNEPENPYNEPSMTLTASQELTFINNNLGPTIRNAGYGTKIIGFDHNCDNTSYPTQVANGSSYVDGSAFHLYSGSISALTTVKNATNKNVYFTEQWTSSAGSFGGDLSWHTQNVTLGAANNWAKAMFEWNLANNSGMGPRTPGGCTQCLGAITVNNSTSFTRNVSYYIIAHVSKFVNINAVRIGTSSTNGSLVNTAFKNPDGSKSLVVVNSGATSTFRVVWNNSSFTYTLNGGDVVTFKWSGTTPPPPTGAPIGQTITLKGFNNQFVSSENGTAPMWCNRATAGVWEKFLVVDAGAGKIALQSMGKYVSSENGAASGITCNRTSFGGTGSWEQFDWVGVGTTQVALRGNNAQYISSENGTAVMKCNRATYSGWETFTWTSVAPGEANLSINESAIKTEAIDLYGFNLYPNPSLNGKFIVRLNQKPLNLAHIKVLDMTGRAIITTATSEMELEMNTNNALKPGIYQVQVLNGSKKIVKKIAIQ